MSYYIELTLFKGCIEPAEVLTTAQNFCKRIINESLESEIKSNLIYSPNYDKILDSDSKYPHYLDRTDIIFFKYALSYKFMYWKKYKLLAVVGQYKFNDMQSIYFQNSCDQDEEYEKWEPLMDNDPCRNIFREIVTNSQSGNIKNEIKQYFEDDSNDDDRDYDSDYYRRWYCYSRIEDALSINEWLSDEYENINTFVLNAIATDKDLGKMNSTARKVIAEEIKKLSELE